MWNTLNAISEKHAIQRLSLFARSKFVQRRTNVSGHQYLAIVLWIVALPVYGVCLTDPWLSPTDQIEVDRVYHDNHLTEAEISMVTASNALQVEQQEKVLLAILNESPDMSIWKLVEFAKLSPMLVIPVLSEVEEIDRQCMVVQELIGHWVEIDLRRALDLIKELHLATLDDLLLRESVAVLARAHPEHALGLAHEYLGRFGYVLESVALQGAVDQDPLLAVELIPKLRREFYPFTTYNERLTIFEPLFELHPTYAVEFGNSLSGSNAESYFWLLTDMFCDFVREEYAEPQQFIDLKERIPVKGARASTSYCLLKQSLDDNRNLTEVQFEALREELDSDDLEEIDAIPRSQFIGES